MNIIEAIQVSKTYAIGKREIPVLNDISLSVKPGEFLVVEGSSGSGKTTLLSLLSGLDRPTAGRIVVDGTDITDTTEDDLAPMRNEIFGFVFQSFHLVPSLTALENVMFPAELRHDREAEEKAHRLLQRVGLAHRIDNFPHQLSGGEMQRVAICRALINRPKIIFADEPTGNLDSHTTEEIMNVFDELSAEGNTLIVITHEHSVASRAEHRIHLVDGRVV